MAWTSISPASTLVRGIDLAPVEGELLRLLDGVVRNEP
ncbi:hypothetical protein AKJ09_04500 [Labilithrix luteola]|uniref:Uncharacterized protein n=1 Tax=Labilithrix luteola TaxID=1391654 RepID=A0A0K1PWT4_9BACT|nr:hypothetical protein AKJ09_04500 [Labilithrix luteola]